MYNDKNKDGKIVLFKNNDRIDDKSPILRGTAYIDGKEYKIALWGKTSKAGDKYWGGSIENKPLDNQKMGM